MGRLIFASLLCGCYLSHPAGGERPDAEATDAGPTFDVPVRDVRVVDAPSMDAPSMDAPTTDAGADTPIVSCDERGRDTSGRCACDCRAAIAPDGCERCECQDVVRVEAGEFRLGSPEAEDGREDDETQHRVRITRPFLMDRYEVSQAEWRRLMGNSPATFAGCPQCPVETVNFIEALHYANARSREEGLEPCYALEACTPDVGAGCPDDGRDWRRCNGTTCGLAEFAGVQCEGWRLPTEAEWEFAARAGSDAPLPDGSGVENATTFGWCSDAGGRTHPRGEKPANAWGLFDIFGNVYEWTWDRYAPYVTEPSPRIDPVQEVGQAAVIRGGSWAFGDSYCRSANRGARERRSRENMVGFRLVRTID